MGREEFIKEQAFRRKRYEKGGSSIKEIKVYVEGSGVLFVTLYVRSEEEAMKLLKSQLGVTAKGLKYLNMVPSECEKELVVF